MKSRDDRKNSPFEDRKKFCPFSQKNSPKIDYKDIRLIQSDIWSKTNKDNTKYSNNDQRIHMDYPNNYLYLCHCLLLSIKYLLYLILYVFV